MFSRLWQWIDDRWPLSTFIRLGLEEEIPGGASFAYVLGSATLIIFLLQVVTGIWQLFYYVPTVDHAYDSLNYLRKDVPFGWLIHGLHYWGASAMVILVALHTIRVFIWGAYKRPRELTWLTGVVLLMLTMTLSFTGAPLPWDERGYWAAQVGTNIAGTIPFIGDVVKRLLRGGEVMGQLTLSRFFILHAAILPGALMILITAHLIAFRQFGGVGPWDEAKRKRCDPFWPHQVFKNSVVVGFLLLLLIALSVYAPPPFAGPADPVDTSYVPKPEWNFLFLYQALKFFSGRFEPLGTVGIPTVGFLLLVLLPFLDRRPERHPARRPFVLAGGLILVGAVITLTIFGYYSNPGGTQTTDVPSPGASVAHLSASAREGARLFHTLGCIGCHRANGTGGTVGPDLSDEANRGRSRGWLTTQIENPKMHNPQTSMPAFSMLSDQQANQLVDYLSSLGGSNTTTPTNTTSVTSGTSLLTTSAASTTTPSSSGGPPGPAADIIGNASHGDLLFKRECESCHGPQGAGNVPNPGSDEGNVPPLAPMNRALFSAHPQDFAENIDRMIQNGSVPDGPHPVLKMPGFGKTHALTQQEISDIEAYVLRLNGVDRAQLQHPGLSPRRYFRLTVVAFAMLCLGLGAVWVRQRNKAGSPFSEER